MCLDLEHIPYEREARLIPDRKWRFDFAIRYGAVDLAIEVQGGTWMRGRHSRGSGQDNDMRKANAATMAGYKVLSYSTQMVASGECIRDILTILGKTS
jgi:hypothetical protein